jgi:hypothetical protein
MRGYQVNGWTTKDHRRELISPCLNRDAPDTRLTAGKQREHDTINMVVMEGVRSRSWLGKRTSAVGTYDAGDSGFPTPEGLFDRLKVVETL